MSKKTYICKAYVGVIVEAEDTFEAEALAGLEMDIGDIDWEAEEADPEHDYFTTLQNYTIEGGTNG
jgi:hypothetical protein